MDNRIKLNVSLKSHLVYFSDSQPGVQYQIRYYRNVRLFGSYFALYSSLPVFPRFEVADQLLECFSLIKTGELVIQASLARKASSALMDFYRLDYPEIDPPEWRKFLPIRLEDDEVKVRELPQDYHLKPPYSSTYEENYRLHCEL